MVSTEPTPELVQRGRQAAARGAWREAYDLLTSADASGELSPEDLELLGEATSWSGPSEFCIAVRERAYAGYTSRGDGRGAARVALRLGRDYTATHNPSVAAGWRKTAERLLEAEPPCPEHGYLALVKAWAAEARGDLAEAGAIGRSALDTARAFGDRELEVLAIHLEGWLLLARGDAEEGWALIDEAAVAAAAGELGPNATGSVYCGTISACRDLFELRRASEWTSHFQHWCDKTSLPGAWRGDCRVHRAEVLRRRGAWGEAEREAASACEDFLAFNLAVGVAEASYELGEVKLRQGDLAGAEDAFRRADELGVEPQPGRALLRLAEGDPRAGLRELTRALEDARDDRLRRARLLPAIVEIAHAAGEIDTVDSATVELEELSNAFRSDALAAAAHWGKGLLLLARGDPAGAGSSLREAVRRWNALDSPYEAASARVVLADAYRAAGDDEDAASELEAARSAFERLGARAAAERIAGRLQHREGRRTAATFLFSDICGSTSLVEAIGDEAWLSLVAWHDRTLRALFVEHGGEEIDHAGDGFFVAFRDAASALACAAAIQRSLAQHRREHGFAPEVRIGVHSAEALAGERGYRGKGVHAAARIAAAAAGGEILASAETAAAAGMAASDLRLVTLKGIAEPLELVTVAWA